MPKVDLYNIEGKIIGDINLADEVFGIEVNESVLHDAVVSQLANKRQGTSSTKTKSEVRGGGRKPWKQKGTGRARQGSIRSAQWIKGGIIFGPTPRSYRIELPKKVKRLALKSALTTKANASSIIVLDDFQLEEIKTKKFVEVMKNLNIESSALVLLNDKSFNVQKSARNVDNVKTAGVETLNVYDILKYDKFVVTKDAVNKVEEVYSKWKDQNQLS